MPITYCLRTIIKTHPTRGVELNLEGECAHKVSLFVWKLMHDNLPTLCARKRRNLLPTCSYTVLLLEPTGIDLH